MIVVSDELFEKFVTDSIDKVPEPYKSQIQNMAFFIENEPNDEQRKRLGLRPCQSLFGLYEGVPLTMRHGNNTNLLPDRITIFKSTHEQYVNTLEELKSQITNTVWHEVAHYFGLDHKRINELEKKL